MDAGGYQILHPIASGGMGDVSLGRATGAHGFEKLVAIKRIRKDLAANPEFVVRFVAEAKLAVSLSHANLVQVFDLARSGGDLYLVMEYVRGADLHRVSRALQGRGERFGVSAALQIGAGTLSGLAYAHERTDLARSGVVHCDVSPANVLVSYSGEVKVADFGVAQVISGGGAAVRRVAGKPPYLSPEQARGDSLDGRADLYSLAVTLYEVLSGTRPFPFTSFAEAAQKRAEPRPLSEVRTDIPRPFSDLLARAMSFDREQRPASARAMLSEVVAIARSAEVVTSPEIGTWVERLVPGTTAISGGPLSQGLARLLRASGMRPSLGTKSVMPPPEAAPAIKTFVRRGTEQGTTIWEEQSPVAPRARAVQVGVAVLGLGAMTALGATALRSRHPAAAPKALPQMAMQVEPPAEPAAVAIPVPQPPPAPKERASPAKAAKGFVSIYADPWANVAIDGKPVGTTPLRNLPVAAGSRRVRLIGPSGKKQERVVRVSPGETQYIDVDLRP